MAEFGNVFSSNTVKIEIDTGAQTGVQNFVELIETTGASISNDLNVDERDVYSDIFTRRTATGGKKFDIKFTSILSPGNPGHEFLRRVAFSDNILLHNNNIIKFTFPFSDETNSTQRTETYKGVLKFDSVGPGDSLDLAKMEYSLMVSGQPVVVEEEA